VARNHAAAAEITKGGQIWLMVALTYGIGTKVQTESRNVPTGSDLGTMAGTKQVESPVAVWFATVGKAEGLKTRISIDRPAVVATRLDCGMLTSKRDVGQGVDPAGRHARQVAAAALKRGWKDKDGSWKRPRRSPLSPPATSATCGAFASTAGGDVATVDRQRAGGELVLLGGSRKEKKAGAASASKAVPPRLQGVLLGTTRGRAPPG